MAVAPWDVLDAELADTLEEEALRRPRRPRRTTRRALASPAPEARLVGHAQPRPSFPKPLARASHCPWCGYAIRGLVPACPGCIDLEAALHENTEPGVTFHGAAPGSDTKGL